MNWLFRKQLGSDELLPIKPERNLCGFESENCPERTNLAGRESNAKPVTWAVKIKADNVAL